MIRFQPKKVVTWNGSVWEGPFSVDGSTAQFKAVIDPTITTGKPFIQYKDYVWDESTSTWGFWQNTVNLNADCLVDPVTMNIVTSGQLFALEIGS